MSRNPILTDKAFQEAAPGGLTTGHSSPAEEWERAQGMQGGGTSTEDPAAAAPAAAAGNAGGFRADRATGRDIPAEPVTDGKVMTMGGVAAATFVLFAFLLVAAWVGWQSVDLAPNPAYAAGIPDATRYLPSFSSPALLWIAIFGALGLGFLTAFKPKLARITGVLYALFEGYVLGAISAYYGALYQGIVAQAVLATLGVFLMMLALYGLRILRATPRFVKGVIGATFGIMFMYLGVFVLNIFGVGDGFWTSGSPLGIVISLVVVVVAALNLILDFDFIEQGSKMGLPRYMDWYAGFGLLVTLVWLYLEMLRLFARLRN